MKTGYKVLDVMTNKPIIASKELSMKDAAKFMKEKSVNSLLIIENELPIGIITDEDCVRKVLAEGLDAKKTRIKEIMSNELVTIQPNKDIYDALILMRDHGIRQLPVLDGKKLVGFLTLKDILKIEPELIDLLVEQYEMESRRPQFDEQDVDNILPKKKFKFPFFK